MPLAHWGWLAEILTTTTSLEVLRCENCYEIQGGGIANIPGPICLQGWEPHDWSDMCAGYHSSANNGNASPRGILKCCLLPVRQPFPVPHRSVFGESACQKSACACAMQEYESTAHDGLRSPTVQESKWPSDRGSTDMSS